MPRRSLGTLGVPDVHDRQIPDDDFLEEGLLPVRMIPDEEGQS